MIVDTCTIIDLIHNNQQAKKKVAELKQLNTHFITTSVTIYEIEQGLDTRDFQARKKIGDIMRGLGIIPFDREAAIVAGQLSRELRERGVMIPTQDCMIAGIALPSNQSLLTGNKKHFERIEELKVESY